MFRRTKCSSCAKCCRNNPTKNETEKREEEKITREDSEKCSKQFCLVASRTPAACFNSYSLSYKRARTHSITRYKCTLHTHKHLIIYSIRKMCPRVHDCTMLIYQQSLDIFGSLCCSLRFASMCVCMCSSCVCVAQITTCIVSLLRALFLHKHNFVMCFASEFRTLSDLAVVVCRRRRHREYISTETSALCHNVENN